MPIDDKQLDDNVIQNEPAESQAKTENTPLAGSPHAPRPSDAEGAQPPHPPKEEPRPKRRGFAAMDRDRVKEIASKGGRAAHAAGTAHQFSSDEARIAGRKGGMAPHVRRGGVRRRPTKAPENATPASNRAEQGDGR